MSMKRVYQLFYPALETQDIEFKVSSWNCQLLVRNKANIQYRLSSLYVKGLFNCSVIVYTLKNMRRKNKEKERRDFTKEVRAHFTVNGLI